MNTPTPSRILRRTPWMAVAAMFVLNGALFGIWASRIPAIAARFELAHGALGLLLLALAAGAVCSFPFAGRAVDQRGAAEVTRAVAVLYPVTLMFLALAPGVMWLALALFLFGAAHGAMDVAMNAWGAEVERRAERPVMSGFHAMFSLGAGLGALSGYGAVSFGLGVPGHFVLAGAGVFAVTFPWALISWRSAGQGGGAGALFAFPTGALFWVGLVAFCTSVGEGAMADWSAIYLRDITQVGEGAAALGYAAFSVAMVVVRLLGDRIIGYLGTLRTAQISGALVVAGILLMVLVPRLEVALIGFALLGIGYAVIIPMAFSRAANDPVVPPGQGIARVATLGYGGLLLGPVLIGGVASVIGLQLAFVLLAVLGGVTAALARALK